MKTKMKKPNFDSYACAGDSITWKTYSGARRAALRYVPL